MKDRFVICMHQCFCNHDGSICCMYALLLKHWSCFSSSPVQWCLCDGTWVICLAGFWPWERTILVNYEGPSVQWQVRSQMKRMLRKNGSQSLLCWVQTGIAWRMVNAQMIVSGIWHETRPAEFTSAHTKAELHFSVSSGDILLLSDLGNHVVVSIATAVGGRGGSFLTCFQL